MIVTSVKYIIDKRISQISTYILFLLYIWWVRVIDMSETRLVQE